MKPLEIEDRVRALVQLANTDPDAAALGADDLRIEVLQAIADDDTGGYPASELAASALRTVDQDVGGR